MRPVLASLLVLTFLSGCASTDAAPLVHVLAPARDPYAIVPGALGEFPAMTRVWAPGPRGWPDEGFRDDVAALSSVVTIEVRRGLSVVTGPLAHADAVAAYLADRARFGHARIDLVVQQGRLPAGALAFEALAPCEGGLFAVVDAAHVPDALCAALEPGRLLAVEDGERGHLTAQDLRSYIRGCPPAARGGRYIVRGPSIDVLRCPQRIDARPCLGGDAGDVLALDWEQRTRRSDPDQDVQVWIRDDAGFTSVPVAIPRIHDHAITGRFILRMGEALVLLEATTDRDDVQVTVVSWSSCP